MNTTKKIKLLDFHFKKHLGSSLFGVYKSAFIGSGVEFASLREYEFGESLKNIDWKTTAKKGKLFTRKYEEERDLNVIFVINNTLSMHFGSEQISKKQLLESVVYALGLSAVENSDNVGGCILGDGCLFLPPKKGIESLFLLIDGIKNAKVSPTPNIEETFSYLLKKHIKNSFIVVLSDETALQKPNLLKSLSLQNQLLYINIFDAFENHLLGESGNMTLGGLGITLGSGEKQKEYENLRQQKLQVFKKEVENNGADYLMLDTRTDIYKTLLEYFYKIQ